MWITFLFFSKDIDAHKQHVHQVLQRLLENKLFVKAEKCEFYVSSVSFLGYIIAQGELRMNPAKVRAVTEWPVPMNLKQLQHFLGFANFYRQLIRDYSRLAAPLTALTSTSTTSHWFPEAEAAFQKLKYRFTSAPILTQPDPELQFVQHWGRCTSVTTFSRGSETPSLCLLFPQALTCREKF
jgi:hypothetical protein